MSRPARGINARLILVIQPGRSPFSSEVRALERCLREPDVDLALDPEWNVGRDGVPGRIDGSVNARPVNGVSDQLSRLVRRYRLAQKLLVIHPFRRESVRYESRIRRSPAVATTLSFDGIGSANAKVAGYDALSSSHLFNGFCLFYRLDRRVMSLASVMRLDPRLDEPGERDAARPAARLRAVPVDRCDGACPPRYSQTAWPPVSSPAAPGSSARTCATTCSHATTA